MISGCKLNMYHSDEEGEITVSSPQHHAITLTMFNKEGQRNETRKCEKGMEAFYSPMTVTNVKGSRKTNKSP